MKTLKLRFIKECPEFVGLDSKIYGKYFENSIDEIPFENAVLLMANQYARIEKNWLKQLVQKKGIEKIKEELKEGLERLKKKGGYTFAQELKLDDLVEPAIWKSIEQELEEKQPLIIETEKARYELLESNGLTLHHAGWYIDYGNFKSFAQLFYSYTKVKEDDEEKEKILPYIFECRYNEMGKIVETKIIPVRELDYLELPDTIAKVEKKTLGVSGLPTQLPLEVVRMIMEGNLEDSVSLKDIYLKIWEKVNRFIDMKPINLKITILWTMATYFSDVFGIMPLLVFLGSTGSGKTRTLKIICSLARKGIMITDPTDANLPRIIDAWKPTLGIDDLDEAMKANRKMVMSLLKHVYKNTVYVPRLTAVGKRFFLELFSPFSPVAITTTEPIEEEQLFSRCIFIEMSKSKKKLPNREPDIFYFKDERDKLYLLSYLLAPKVAEAFNELDIPLKGRDFEIWSPILTIAKLIDEEIFKEVLEKAIQESKEKEEEIYRDEKTIIFAVRKMFENSSLENVKGERYVEFTAKELREEVKELLVSEWNELSESEFEKRWKVQRIGRILSRMNIPQKRVGSKGLRKRIVTESLLKDLEERYLITDITDNTDNKIGMQKEEIIAKNGEKTEKNGISESVSETMHSESIVSNVSVVSGNFVFIEPYYGRCSYCGKMKELRWKDLKGNHLCDECKREEESKGENNVQKG